MKSAGFKEAYYILLNRTEKGVIVLQWEGSASHMVGTLENERCHREHVLSQRACASTLTTYKATRTLRVGCQKGIFSWSGMGHIVKCLVQENRGQRRQADPSTGRRLGLAWHGPDSQPPWRDGREREQGPSAAVGAWASRLGLMWKMGQKIPTEQRVSWSRW